jgi:hypothetical protein
VQAAAGFALIRALLLQQPLHNLRDAIAATALAHSVWSFVGLPALPITAAGALMLLSWPRRQGDASLLNVIATAIAAWVLAVLSGRARPGSFLGIHVPVGVGVPATAAAALALAFLAGRGQQQQDSSLTAAETAILELQAMTDQHIASSIGIPDVSNTTLLALPAPRAGSTAATPADNTAASTSPPQQKLASQASVASQMESAEPPSVNSGAVPNSDITDNTPAALPAPAAAGAGSATSADDAATSASPPMQQLHSKLKFAAELGSELFKALQVPPYIKPSAVLVNSIMVNCFYV